jgi:hypothetical protein
MLLYKSWTFLFCGNCCTVYYSVTDRQTNCWVGGYWKVGPIPIDDSLGKEVVTRLITNLTSNEFYTDSNGCDFLKQVKIWCFCFLLIRSSAVEKKLSLCRFWIVLGDSRLEIWCRQLLPWLSEPEEFLGSWGWSSWIDLQVQDQRTGWNWTAKELAGNYYPVHTLLSAYILWV